jgi:hypothetical protein
MPAEYEPTQTNRDLVKQASAAGVSHKLMASRLGIDGNTLRKHFGSELDEGMFKAHAAVGGGIVTMCLYSPDPKIRAEMSKWYSARQMGWKETVAQEHSGPDGGPIETEDVSARELFDRRIAGIAPRRSEEGIIWRA